MQAPFKLKHADARLAVFHVMKATTLSSSLQVLREYRISNAQVSIRCNATMDDIIDTLEADWGFCWVLLGLVGACWVGGILECPMWKFPWECAFQPRAIESTAQRFMWWTRSIRSPLKNLTLLRRLCEPALFSCRINLLQQDPQETALFVPLRCHIMYLFVRIMSGISMVWSRWFGDTWAFWGQQAFPFGDIIDESWIHVGNLCQQHPSKKNPMKLSLFEKNARIYTKPRGQIPDYTVSFGMVPVVVPTSRLQQMSPWARLQWSSLLRRIKSRTWWLNRRIFESLIDRGFTLMHVFFKGLLPSNSQVSAGTALATDHSSPSLSFFTQQRMTHAEVQGCSGVGYVSDACLFLSTSVWVCMLPAPLANLTLKGCRMGMRF